MSKELQQKVYNNKYNFFLLLIFFLIELISINFARYNYDGFHLGLLINSANDLESGKLIYKDFFYPYGFLNLNLNKIILNLFNYNIFFLYIFYIQIYLAGIFLFYLLTKKILNIKYASFSLIVFLAIHPFVLKPWHNYILFFLINLFVYLKYQKNFKSELFSSLILGTSFLLSETFFIASFLIFFFELILFFKFFGYRKILYKIGLFLLPLFIFLLYLISFNIYDDWIFNSKIFSVLLNFFYKKDLLEYIFSYATYFALFYKKILSQPYIFFYLIIFLSNIFYILFSLKNIFHFDEYKKDFLLFLSLLNLILISQSLNNISIFKLATLSTFGLITLLYIIENLRDYYFKKGSKIVLILLCLMIFFSENLHILKKINNHQFTTSNDISFIKNQKYTENTWKNLSYLNKIVFKLKEKCQIEYFVNFTDDAYYYYILNKNFKSLQYFYWFKNIDKDFQNVFYLAIYNNFDRGINKKIKTQMKTQNIVFITDLYNQKRIKFISDDVKFDYEYIDFKGYYFINLPYSEIHGKKILLIPDNCLLTNDI